MSKPIDCYLLIFKKKTPVLFFVFFSLPKFFRIMYFLLVILIKETGTGTWESRLHGKFLILSLPNLSCEIRKFQGNPWNASKWWWIPSRLHKRQILIFVLENYKKKKKKSSVKHSLEETFYLTSWICPRYFVQDYLRKYIFISNSGQTPWSLHFLLEF